MFMTQLRNQISNNTQLNHIKQIIAAGGLDTK